MADTDAAPNKLAGYLLEHPVVEYFVPDDLRGSRTRGEIRTRLFVAFSVGLLVFGAIPFALVHWLFLGLHGNAIAMGLGLVGFVLGLGALRLGSPAEVVCHWMSLVVLGVLAAVGFSTGGMESPAVPWLIAVPIYALVFDNLKTAAIWAAVVACVLTGFLLEGPLGLPVEDGVGDERLELLRYLGFFALTIVILELFALHRFMDQWLNAQWRATREELQEQALYDPLTELPNRLLFRDRLDQRIERVRRRTESFAVAFLDIDGFQAVNDSFGPVVGDQVVCAVGRRMYEAVSEDDTVARIGGDEFTALLDEVASVEDVESIAAELESMFELPLELEDVRIDLRASIGFAFVDADRAATVVDDIGVDSIVLTADRALDSAKDLTGTSWRVLDVHAKGESTRHIQKRNRIREGIERGEFTPHFQPIFSTDGLEMLGVEMLARWEHPSLGTVSPAEFIPVAEESELICELGEQLMTRAFEELVDSSVEEFVSGPLHLFVNLSPRQLDHEDWVGELLERADTMCPEFIELGFEITENELLKNHHHAQKIRDAGYSVVVDDFGTGQASFRRLKDIEIDWLKLDMQFVQGAVENTVDAGIVETISELGHRLEIPVIAEGVETEGQLKFVREAGCDAAQGYYMARPSGISKLR